MLNVITDKLDSVDDAVLHISIIKYYKTAVYTHSTVNMYKAYCWSFEIKVWIFKKKYKNIGLDSRANEKQKHAQLITFDVLLLVWLVLTFSVMDANSKKLL